MAGVTSTRNYIAEANAYIKGVLSGKILACKWVKLACERQQKDLDRAKKDKSWGYRFDVAKATRICKFIELLPHIKGPKAGQRIRLEPWQIFILTTVFGWLDCQGLRRFRRVYIEVPRGNAKSTLTSGVGLYMLALDGEGGAEVYSAATTRDQAKIVFADAQAMARRSPEFLRRYGVQVNAHNISVLETSSKFEALSADADTLDGKNIHFAAIDELHAHKTRSVHDVVETGMSKRLQSLLWEITTAGSNRSGICYEIRDYITKILQSVVSDESYFGIIYTIDEEDNWASVESWIKANPNWGVSVTADSVGQLAKKAISTPAAQNNFKTKHLNVWVSANSAYFSIPSWERCSNPSLRLDEMEGERCWIGLDLASKNDIAAMAIIFRTYVGKYRAFMRYWLPQATIDQSNNSQYQGWALEGWLLATPGNIIDFAYIENELLEWCSRFDVSVAGYDPFQATQFATRMSEAGVPMLKVQPNVLNFSEPMKELDALTLSGKFEFDGDPVLLWMASNVVAHHDNKDNVYPRKERPENKIDGVVALLTALACALKDEGLEGSYEDHGLRLI